MEERRLSGKRAGRRAAGAQRARQSSAYACPWGWTKLPAEVGAAGASASPGEPLLLKRRRLAGRLRGGMIVAGVGQAHSMATGLEVHEREGSGGAGGGVEGEGGSGAAEPLSGGGAPGEVDVMRVDFLLSSSSAAEPSARMQVRAAGIRAPGSLCACVALCVAVLSFAQLR